MCVTHTCNRLSLSQCLGLVREHGTYHLDLNPPDVAYQCKSGNNFIAEQLLLNITLTILITQSYNNHKLSDLIQKLILKGGNQRVNVMKYTKHQDALSMNLQKHNILQS